METLGHIQGGLMNALTINIPFIADLAVCIDL